MASSGTVATTVVQVSDIADSIIRRVGGDPADITPEIVDIITKNLFYVLSNMSNRGVNLWRLYQPLIALYLGQADYDLADGDIDIEQMYYRLPTRITAETVTSSNGGTVANLSDADVDTICTQVAINGNFKFDWGSGETQQIALIGLLAGSTTSYTLLVEISNDNATWTTVLAPGAVDYVAGEWHWYAIEPTGFAARYIRVRETAGGTLSFAEISLAAQWNDLQISRMNQDDYFAIPNKRSVGDPRQYWFDRQITPRVRTWPVARSTFNLLAPLVHRHIEDPGQLTNTLNIPVRWNQAIITMTAFIAFLELPKKVIDMARYELLKEEAAAISLPDAEAEEQDDSPMTITPQIGVYTR